MTHATLKVKDIMSREVQTVERNDQLAVADRRMSERRIRHLPVLDADGSVCAVVSQRDLFRGALLRNLGYGARAEETLLRQVVVKEAISDALYTTTPETPIAAAAQLMLEKKIGCLPVLEDGKLVGIVTEADFVRLAATP
ncbi:MAG TPA: CBS domain-containing protein [Burkholderiales bacterium]